MRFKCPFCCVPSGPFGKVFAPPTALSTCADHCVYYTVLYNPILKMQASLQLYYELLKGTS